MVQHHERNLKFNDRQQQPRPTHITKYTTLAFFNALTSVQFKGQFKFQSIVRGRLNMLLFDESTAESKQIGFAMRRNSVSCFNEKSAATGHFQVHYAFNDDMFKVYETAKVFRLFNIAMDMDIYYESYCRFVQLFVGIFPSTT